MIPHWRDGGWDLMRLGGRLLPGYARDVRVAPSRAVSKVRPKGADGPQLKDEGYDGATVTWTQRIWTGPLPVGDYQLVQLADELAFLSPRRPGAPATPLEIQHPSAFTAGVLNIYIIGYEIGMPIFPGGYLDIPFNAAEWFPPEATKPTQQGANSKAGTGLPGGDGGPIANGNVPDPDPANLPGGGPP